MDVLQFKTREEFRKWLNENCLSRSGVWLLFLKEEEKAITAGEALEEALCFGWIDGQMQRIDGKTYKKYFCLRKTNSKWSEKNKKLAEELEEKGLMTDYGREKIDEAKRNGQWYAPAPEPVTDAQIEILSEILKKYEPAYSNFKAMPPSVKKTYTKAYLAAKTEDGRNRRIAQIVDRLNKNLRPM